MSEKIDFSNVRDNLLGWFLVNGIVASGAMDAKSPDGFAFAHPPKGKLLHEVSLILNGVELPVERTFQEIEKQMDRMIAEKAAKIVAEKVADKIMVVTDLLNRLEKEVLITAKKDLGLEITEEEY
jgi:tyrosyl-tRNA synthetase